MTSDLQSWLIGALVLVTFILALRTIWAVPRIVNAYLSRGSDTDLLSWIVRWVVIIGILAIVVSALISWALLRYAFPQLNLGGLPAPWTSITVLLLVDVPLLWVITLDRTWVRLRREGNQQ